MAALEKLSKAFNNADSIIVSGKTAQFAILLERCKNARQKIPTTPGRDAVQALLSNLHFTDLVDALEVMFAERAQLELMLRKCSPIETIDDVQVIEQYIVGLQHTNSMAKDEIARLNSDQQIATAEEIDGGAETDTFEDSVDGKKARELNERLIGEIKQLKKQTKHESDNAGKESKVIKEELASLKKELSAANQKAAFLKEELSRCEKREEERLAEVKYFQIELEHSMKSNASIASTISEPLDRKIHELEKKTLSLTEDIEKYQQDLIKSELALSDLKSDLRSKKDKIKELEAAIMQKQADKELLSAQKELESQRKTLTVAKEELLKVREQLHASNKQIINQQYLKNVTMSFLSTPSQRQYMLEVLCKLLSFTDEEKSRIVL